MYYFASETYARLVLGFYRIDAAVNWGFYNFLMIEVDGSCIAMHGIVPLSLCGQVRFEHV